MPGIYPSVARPYLPDAGRYRDFFDEITFQRDGVFPAGQERKIVLALGTLPTEMPSTDLKIGIDAHGFDPEDIRIFLRGRMLRVQAFQTGYYKVNHPGLVEEEIHKRGILHAFKIQPPFVANEIKAFWHKNQIWIWVPLCPP
ncbi:MAG: hypothetical protein OHK0053_29120 [Microscillaceae bacterium]